MIFENTFVMDVPVISVIVPVYNSEMWLRRCVDSILSQTSVNMELLLVDDGSTDKSVMICDEYAAADSRVRVYHKENGGVSSARNVGLDNARGEWVTFIDSDDFMSPGILDSYLRKGAGDLVISEWKYQNTDNSLFFQEQNGDKVLFGNEIIEMIVNCGWQYWATCCNKLYRRSLIEKEYIRFNPAITIEEDLLFNWIYVLHTTCISTISDISFTYCGNASSSSQRLHPFSAYLVRLEILSVTLSGIQNLSLRRRVQSKFLFHDTHMLKSLYVGKLPSGVRRKTLGRIRKIFKSASVSHKYIKGGKNKLMYIVLSFFPAFPVDVVLEIFYGRR